LSHEIDADAFPQWNSYRGLAQGGRLFAADRAEFYETRTGRSLVSVAQAAGKPEHFFVVRVQQLEAEPDQARHDDGHFYTRNIVYKEALASTYNNTTC